MRNIIAASLLVAPLALGSVAMADASGPTSQVSFPPRLADGAETGPRRPLLQLVEGSGTGARRPVLQLAEESGTGPRRPVLQLAEGSGTGARRPVFRLADESTSFLVVVA